MWVCVHVSVAQSCLTLWDPIDCSPPSSSVHGIFQTRILEWVVIPFSRGIFLTQGSNLGLLHCRQTLYHLSHQGSPNFHLIWHKPNFLNFTNRLSEHIFLGGKQSYSLHIKIILFLPFQFLSLWSLFSSYHIVEQWDSIRYPCSSP